MKIFHKKFLNQQEEIKNISEQISTQTKTRMSYVLNQFLIWGVILLIIFLIFKFFIVEFI